MLYVFPELSKPNLLLLRLGGPGLGNLLYPWARAEIAARDHKLPIIGPTWPQIKLGPFIRRERDKRAYFRIFRPAKEYIVGIRKIFLLLFARWQEEEACGAVGLHGSSIRGDNTLHARQSRGPKVVAFSGLGNYFEDFLSDHAFLRDRLLEIARDGHRAGLEFDFQHSVSLHIRLSDFKINKQTTPIEFFVDKINQLRRWYKDLKVFVFTDGSEDEISQISSLGNTQTVSFGSSLADLLALSRSRVLIASAGSTFSGWASFLGRMPVIWPKSESFRSIYYDQPHKELTLGIHERIPVSYLRLVGSAIENGSS